ncbi:MAG: YhjD/YihY/BrkB family envelope integrity protein, partial [Bacteroidota bacterium]|nr:YhjD/YihY/BrkB family envelope integrity protein [Bacteroidota bacterium]
MGKTSGLGSLITELWLFFTKDLWRATRHESKGIKNILLNLLRTLYLAVRGYVSDKLSVRASALTYTTLLAVVPVVAIIIGIARGFGFQEMIENQLTKIFPGQTNLLEMLFGFVQKYLEVAT